MKNASNPMGPKEGQCEDRHEHEVWKTGETCLTSLERNRKQNPAGHRERTGGAEEIIHGHEGLPAAEVLG